jgi:hypothetical protein
MLKILMLNTKKSYLPEVESYKQYFFDTAEVYFWEDIEKSDIQYFDIIWKFMGFDFKKLNLNSQLLIHEYPSLSAGLFPHFKNYLKYKFNAKPDLRIFLNENVKSELNFKDNINFLYRDMGVHRTFFNHKEAKKKYDFVYIGEINKDRQIDKLLNKFTKKENQEISILLIGTPKDNIKTKYEKYKNITFTGYIHYKNIPTLASKAEYGINWIPNKYPYNLQTSTKLIEYCAMNLKIINLKNDWSLKFEKDRNAKFFNVDSNFKIDLKKLNDFQFSTPNVSDLEWSLVLKKSKVKEIILDMI